MAKTRRQRSIDHPDKPKKGVRDLSRRVEGVHYDKNPAAVALGRMGGNAPHKKRGLQAASPATVAKVTAARLAKQQGRKQQGYRKEAVEETAADLEEAS